MQTSKRTAVLATLLLLLTAVGINVYAERAGFPNPASGIREDTPDDPNYDCAEADDPDGGSCSIFAQDIQLFGFGPSGSPGARYQQVPADAARQGIVLGAQQKSGSSVDLAWKTTIGRPEIVLSIVDTGIEWHESELRTKIFLNRNELPLPQTATGATCPDYDCNGDGRFNVEDYADDARVDIAANPNREDIRSVIDAQDLIIAFSDGTDDDSNGYIDDIAGWDFFEDDNDPEDLTSYSAASGHGTGRGTNAARQTNNAAGGAGVCPECMVLPIREWDTFVVPGDHWAAATVYGADLGAHVQIMANGVLQNTRAAKAAATYAHEQGMALMHVSSDLNTANHNYPTNYVESVFINGCIADTETALGSEFSGGGVPGLPISGDTPIGTWFRESNLTQHGAHAHVCNNAVTGSESTGYAGGMAGMIFSAGLNAFEADIIDAPLNAYELKQILTLTAEDVLPGNTLGSGTPDPANPGWDEYFGYGRTNLAVAIDEVMAGRIPPEVLIREPEWWKILDPGETAAGTMIPLVGRVDAPRSASCTFQVEWAPGVSPLDTDLTPFPGLTGLPCTGDGAIAEFPIDVVAAAFPGSRTGGQTADDFNQYVFTVRLVATDAEGNRGEDRKTYFVYRDPTWHEGWPKYVDTGGETSPVLYDLNGDGLLEYIDANSAGELVVYQHDGSMLPSFNGGAPWILPPTFFYHPDSAAFSNGVPPLTTGFRTPSIADIDGDFDPEIVVVAGDGRLFIIGPDGTLERELGIDPSLSEPEDRNAVEHPKRGALGAPVIADLDPDDGIVDIILAALDGHLYVWSGSDGSLRDGFPLAVRDDTSPGIVARGELIATPAVADLNGDGVLEIISSSSEVFSSDPQPPGSPDDIPTSIGDLFDAILANSAGTTSRVYAFDLNGNLVDGWPVSIAGLLSDVLPFIGPQHGVSVGDVDDDGLDEVVASITTGETTLIDSDGTTSPFNSQGVVNGGAESEPTRIFNLFENSIVANVDNAGGLDVIKGGVSANFALNLVFDGQNFPFNHVVQAWDSSNVEAFLPGYPVATDDFMLLSSAAVADVQPGGNREIIAGNGLYLIHAYGANGAEAPGFPKLTGGWNFNTVAIGDVDNDGLLEMAGGTREGYRFIWDLDGPATPDANSEWWMEGHDECHSNNYAFDCRPPNRVTNLASNAGSFSFTAPGDDWGIGTVASYELRTAANPILTLADWQAATPLEGFSNNTPAGETVTAPVPAGASTHIAVVPVDDFGNRARFRSVQVNVPDPSDPVADTGAVGIITAANSMGSPGETVEGGSFSISNTGSEQQEITSVTITLEGNPDIDFIEALILQIAGGGSSEISPITATNVFSLPTPISLAPSESQDFSLQVRFTNEPIVATGGHHDTEWHFFSTAYASNLANHTGKTFPLWPLALMSFALFITLSNPTRSRRFITAGLLGLTLVLAGCSGSDGGDIIVDDDDGGETGTVTTPTARSSATISLSAVGARTTTGGPSGPVSYTGLPTRLGTVSTP